MAGSRRSPVLKDDWRASANDTGDHHRRRPHQSRPYRDRGRERYRERDRPPRPKDNGFDRPLRSPPPSRAFPHPGREAPHKHRGFPSNNALSPRGSPGPPPDEPMDSRRNFNHPRFSQSSDHPDFRPCEATERGPWRDDSPSAPPPSKRKRTRSPSSPRRPYHHPSNPRHPRHNPRYGEGFDRGFSKRGRFSTRGRPGRGSFPRGRARRGRGGSFRGRDSLFPGRGRDSFSPPRGWSRSPYPEDHPEGDFRHRSMSRHSTQSGYSRVSSYSRRDSVGSTRPRRPGMDDSARSPSPHRPISSFDADNASVSGDGDTNMRASNQRSRPPRSPQYMKSNNSYQGSPRSASPYSSGRGGWGGQPPYQEEQGRSSPYWQNGYPPSGPQGKYHPKNQGSYNGPSNSSYHGGHRDAYQGQPQEYGDRGHFSNLQWTASNPRGRPGPNSPHTSSRQPSQSPPPPSVPGDPTAPRFNEAGRPFRPINRDFQREDEGSEPSSEQGPPQNMPPPGLSSANNIPTGPSKGKISFAFKAKTTPAPVPKPVPDLAQRMQPREPPPRVAEPPRSRMPLGPPPKFKPDPRFDRRGRDRGRGRDRDRDRYDRRDFREERGFREPRGGGRDSRRDDRRFERHDRRRGDKRPDFRAGPGRRWTRSPEREWDREPEPEPEPEPEQEPRKSVKIMTRPKPRPTLPEEFTKSDSVYYRKPGNESVIGAGTYGKVFKAIHVYTEQQVALKKIRMEGEKDGFPVTAMREIKLLQHLRSHNVVSLLEVMVERNECFMVFEYLAHDLTGLINHPTFTLTAAHKKDLARQMFDGLNYLHHRGVLHRDIKAANILISNTGLLKYADFGLARFFSKSRQLDYTNRVITIWYRPPELLLGETRYGPAVDVWSAACVYVEMFTKKAVFPGEGGELSQLDKLYNSLGTPTRAEWPDVIEMPWFELMRPTERKKRVFEEQYGSVLTPAALDLVSKIFHYDPAKRPTAEEVLAHPYFVSEEPKPHQAFELEQIEGDWHEFESKALRKEKDREARRVEFQQKEKRKAASSAPQSDYRDPKRVKEESGENPPPSSAPPAEQ